MFLILSQVSPCSVGLALIWPWFRRCLDALWSWAWLGLGLCGLDYNTALKYTNQIKVQPL